MVEITLFNKIKLISGLIISSPLFLILILGLILMTVDILFISKKSKRAKIIYTIISLIVIIFLLNKYILSLLSIFDVIAKNIITIIYFPSVLEYILLLLISLIIVLISIFRKKTNKLIKNINMFVFTINMFIFFLILDQINNEKIDLANKISIYSSELLMALFELSVLIFAIWIIGLILYKIINKITYKEEVIDNFYEEPELPKTIEELRKEELSMPPQIEYIVVEKKSDNDMFTLDEYRQMRKVLELIKEEQNKNKLNME